MPFILVIRSYCYYDSGAVLFASAVSLASVIYYLQILIHPKSRGTGCYLADTLVALGMTALPVYLKSSIDHASLETVRYLMPAIFLLLADSARPNDDRSRTVTALFIMLFGSCLGRYETGLLQQAMTVSIPVISIIVAIRNRYTLTFAFSFIVLLANYASFIEELFKAVVEYRWSLLMITGIGLIFGASYVENGVKRLQRHWGDRGLPKA